MFSVSGFRAIGSNRGFLLVVLPAQEPLGVPGAAQPPGFSRHSCPCESRPAAGISARLN